MFSGFSYLVVVLWILSVMVSSLQVEIVGFSSSLLFSQRWFIVGCPWWVCSMWWFGGVVVMGLGVTLRVVRLVPVSLGCEFDFVVHSTFKGSVFTD